MNMKDYEQDLMDATARRTEMLLKREELDTKIETLSERIDALETLVRTNDRHKGRMILDQQSTPAEAMVNVAQPQVTDRVRHLLSAADGRPLTASELLAQLKQLGWTISPDGQPLSFMYGIGRRLVQQGFAVRVEKNGRVAWARKTSG